MQTNIDDLTKLRVAIDKVDEDIIQLLAKRFALTRRVGNYKKIKKLDPIDSCRERSQAKRLVKLSKKSGLNYYLVLSLYKLIIDEVVKNHKKMLKIS